MQRTGGAKGLHVIVFGRQVRRLSPKRFIKHAQEAEAQLMESHASGSGIRRQLGPILHGCRVSLLRPQKRSLHMMAGMDVRHFSTEDDEFRRQLGRQLRELRQALHGDQSRPAQADREAPAVDTRSEAERDARLVDRRRSEAERADRRLDRRSEAERADRSEGRRSEAERADRSEGRRSEAERADRSEGRRSEPERADRSEDRRSRRAESERLEERSEEAREADRNPMARSRDQRAQRRTELEEPRRGSRRSSREWRSESEESEELERQPRARYYETSESREERRDSRRSNKTVKAESEDVEAFEDYETLEPEEEEELKQRALAKDPHMIEGAYWTGEGKRLEIRFPRRRKVPSGFITGESEEVLKLEDEPVNPRASHRSRKTSEDYKDE